MNIHLIFGWKQLKHRPQKAQRRPKRMWSWWKRSCWPFLKDVDFRWVVWVVSLSLEAVGSMVVSRHFMVATHVRLKFRNFRRLREVKSQKVVAKRVATVANFELFLATGRRSWSTNLWNNDDTLRLAIHKHSKDFLQGDYKGVVSARFFFNFLWWSNQNTESHLWTMLNRPGPTIK